MGRFINDATGVLVSVDDSKDDRFTAGWTREGAKPSGSKPVVVQSATPDESWTVKNLTKFAGDNGIELGKASNKADILAAIAAGPAKPADSGNDWSDASSDQS